MIPRKTAQEILDKALRGIVQETDISMISPGSVVRAIASAHAKSLSELYDTLDSAVFNCFLPTASGFYLDLIGEMFGLSRRVPETAQVLREDRLIRFYVRSGTLAQRLPHPSNLNLGRIAEGTQITSGSVTYVVDRDYDFPASATEAFVGALSLGVGASQKVGTGKLSQHSLGNAQVLVTNTADIDLARDLESDEEFRFRISRFVTSSQGANETAVRLAALSAPGVADILRQPFHAGPGSFRITIIPTGNRVSLDTLTRVRASVAGVVAYGTFFQVEEPRYTPVSMAMLLTPQRGRTTVTPSDRDRSEGIALSYLGSLRPGSVFSPTELRNRVIASSPSVLDATIQSLYLDRIPRVVSDYSLAQDEVLIVDEQLNNPIAVA